jgi:hypothetical protein
MLDFAHILESSLGLTIGGVLLKLIDKTCRSACTEASQPVQTIVQEDTDSEKDVSDDDEGGPYPVAARLRDDDAATDVTVMLSYDHINHLTASAES